MTNRVRILHPLLLLLVALVFNPAWAAATAISLQVPGGAVNGEIIKVKVLIDGGSEGISFETEGLQYVRGYFDHCGFCGKPCLVNDIIHYLAANTSKYCDKPKRIAVCAPTGKASSVLQKKLLAAQVPLQAYDCNTMHSLLFIPKEDCDYDTVRNIHDNLNELMEEAKESPDPLELSRPDVKHLLERSGVPEEKMEHFDKNFEEAVGEKNTLLASNIASVKTFQIETPDIVVKVNPERSDLVETREIDGRRCLVIAIDDHLEVNGIEVR